MNWPELYKNYPLAYAYMCDNFKCLYTFKHPDYIIKHPLKRDLYDFFDGIGLVISINNQLNGAVIHDYFDWDIRTGLDVVHNVSLPETRSLTETEVFTKAFEMLNKTLKEECSK